MAAPGGWLRRMLMLMLALALAPTGRTAAPGPEHDPPADELLAAGTEAYARGDWSAVVLHMEKALRAREATRARLARCRLHRCPPLNGTARGGSGPAWRVVGDLHFFGQILRRAGCLRGCLPVDGATRYLLGEETELEFRKRSPYNYLQVAYFKLNKLSKAVAAANTFFVANPDHMEMRQNLEYYQLMAGVKDSDFVDLEAKPHMEEFRLGVSYYTEEDHQAAIVHLEKALEEYWVADAECRALCEGPYDYDGYNYLEYTADLYQAIVDHYTQVLSCKQGCSTELASQAGQDKPIEDFLPSHFNYLQFAYYNSGNYEKAIECTKTYLLFFPSDEVMNQNLAYYSAVLGEHLAKPIHSRETVEIHRRRSLLEKELLFFAYDIFGIPFVDPDTWTPAEVIPKRLREKQKVERETAARISEEIGNLMKEIETLVEEKTKESSDMSKFVKEGGHLVYDGLSVTMNSRHLNGSQRVVIDGVLSEEDCRSLQRLTNAAASAGDGYRGKTSPHTPSETFYGVTVYKALRLGQEGKVPLQSAYLYYNATEKIRQVVESYFRLEVPLYFSYSHLVCRTAIEDKQEDRVDPSHPVHVDNCILNAEALVCVKEPPAYTFRDYSAILYLNGDFEGGNFYFTELDAETVTSSRTVLCKMMPLDEFKPPRLLDPHNPFIRCCMKRTLYEAEVQPQCGRVVGFSSGSENPHGVKAVTKGQRCAIALWFTLDPRHSERERVQANDLVRMLFHMEETELPPGQAPAAEGLTPGPTEQIGENPAAGKDEL